MKVYKKRKPNRRIAQKIKLLSVYALAVIGMIYLIDQGIEQLKKISYAKTVIIINKDADGNSDIDDNITGIYSDRYLFVDRKKDDWKIGEFSAYNAEPEQTDGSPDITASNKKVARGMIANNCLEFGTKIIIDGMGEYEVQDRMNSRYGCENFDIFFEGHGEAVNFGRQNLKYKIL